MRKNILIINTGGTISSVPTENGYAPATGYIEKMLNRMPVFQDTSLPSFTLQEYEPLLDSSNVTLHEWNELAKRIEQHYHQYDGFLIFHGTDTMAYTASALSFMLQNLTKPVILTGSQIPLRNVRNDAYDNILTSMWLCAHEPLQEVCIYFNQKLLRGNRAQKASSYRFDAFESPNFPSLATIGTNIELKKHLLLPPPTAPFSAKKIHHNFIANFRLFPGFSADLLASLLKQPLKGLILETYGSGNAQNNDKRFLNILKDASDRGIIIVNCSQCHQGYVQMQQYATGASLLEAGLISGHDMTLEAAHCKLLYLLSCDLTIPALKTQLETNLVGELSSDTKTS